MTSAPDKAYSVLISEKGQRLGEEFLMKHFGKESESPDAGNIGEVVRDVEAAGAVQARTANYAEPGLSLHLADGLEADCAERDLCPADLVALAREAF